MSDEAKRALHEALLKKKEWVKYNKLSTFSPYPYQVEFHNDKSPYKSLNAGNRLGKSEVGGADFAYHATGRYPRWWEGKKYTRPLLMIAGGKSNEKCRDIAMAMLLGDPGNEKDMGTGFIPREDIGNSVRKPGVPNAKLHQYVKHYTDGVYDGDTKITFLAYDADDQAWFGIPSDYTWLDEEPPELIMGQAARAAVDRNGSVSMTFTPEMGRTTVLKMIAESWSQHSASWMNASGGDFSITLANKKTLEFKTVYGINGQKGHLTEEKVRNAIKGMLPHQQEMRILGEPMQGSGLIFSYPQDQIMCEPIEIPDHWPRIASVDFGGISEKSHPSAASWGAYDEDNDVIYIYDCLKVYANTIPDVAARVISRPQWIPMMYPHDAMKTIPSGGTIAEEYRRYGVNMFHTHITNYDPEKGEGKGGIRVEPQLVDMNSRFADRRLRIFNTLPEIWEELRNFHTTKTNTGTVKIVDRDDDLIATIRGICSMIRFAEKESDIEDYAFDDDEHEEGNAASCTGY